MSERGIEMFTFQPSDNMTHTHPHAVVFLPPQSYDLRMNHILILLAGLLVAGNVYALPPCPSSGVLNDCSGTQTSANGNKYVGEFKGNKFHGQGTLTLADGSNYVGEFKNGRPWIGITYSKDGSVFSQFHDGVEVAKQSSGSSTNKNVMDDTDKK